MSGARVHARNLLANWVSHGAVLVVAFFLSPFVVHTLGKVEYGIWSLLTVLTGYMGVLDLGVRASTGRYVILHLGKDDHEGVDETVRTSLGFFSSLGLVLVAAGAGVGWLFPAIFRSVPSEYHLLTQLLLPILALNVWLSAIQAVYSSVLVAYDRFDLTRGVDVGVLGIQTAGTVLLLSLGYGISGLAAVVVGCHVLGLIGKYFLARRIYPRLRSWPLMLRWTRLRELLGYGLAVFVAIASARAIGQTNLVVAGIVVDISSVTIYSVGAMLVFYSGTFLKHINYTLFPAIQRAVARSDMDDARWLYFRAGRLALIFGLLVYLGIIVYAEPFIRLWMYGPEFGDECVRQAAAIMTILAAAHLPLLFVGASVPLLNAMGHVRLTAVLACAEAALAVGLSLLFPLALGWGLVGIAAGTLVARLLIGTFIVPWCACAKAGVNWRKYVRSIGGMELLAGSVTLGFFLLARRLLPADSWTTFFGQVALVTAGYGLIATWLLVPAMDRQRVWDWALRRLRASPAR